MAAKDKAEKLLEDYNDVFADIYNTLVFKKPFLKEDWLRNGSTESIYKAEKGELAEQIRDKVMLYGENVLVLATLGIENQSKVEKYMPVRVMGYDFASYQGQLKKNNKLSPVVTIVLNFSDKRWRKPKSLHKLMNITEELEPYVQDYRIEVFDIAYLEDKVIEQFTSDFKVVARFFKEKRLRHQESFLEKDTTVIKHVEAVMELLKVFTGDTRYTELYQERLKERVERGEEIKMCEVIDKYIERGRKEGLTAGRLEGEREGRWKTIFDLVQEGDLTVQRAAEKLGLAVEELIKRMTEDGYKIPVEG